MSEVYLERITEDDAQDFYNLAHSDVIVPSPMALYLGSYVQDFPSTCEMVKEFANQHDGRLYHYYMIKVSNEPIGFISAEYSRLFLKGLYVTYFLGFQFRGMHYMSIALELLLQNLSTSNLPCIFDVNAENNQSRYVIEKLASPIDSYVDFNGKQFLTYLVYP